MNDEEHAQREELVFAALGGLGEIGMNAYLYGWGPPDARSWLLVDLGITFPHDAEPGVDVVLPDLRFIEGERRNLAGIVITHAHEDHIGAVIESWPKLRVPVYGTPFTLGMLRAKLAEYGASMTPEFHEVPVGGRFKVGPFDLEFVTMSHSIPETSGLAMRTPLGLHFHTADWKLDDTPLVGAPTDVAKLEALGREGVATLICDSTNAFRDGISPSETDVAQSLADLIKAQPGQVAITTFSSNVARVRAVSDAARACGRRLVVAGRALHRVIQVAIDTGYLPEDFAWLDQEHFGYLERGEALLLATGSQGEPRAALARISEASHRDIQLTRGDTVIYSSRTIPGNEKAVLAIQNRLAELGATILTDADALVHVTGHPRREELKRMYEWLKPETLVPMHGEVRHLQENARLGRAAGIPQVRVVTNGQLLRLAPGTPAIIDDIPVGRRYRDGKILIDETEGAVRERRKLAVVGLAAVSIVMDQRGNVLGDPDIALDGIPAETAEGESMEDVALDAVDGTLDSIPGKRRKDPELVREAVRRSVRSAIERVWGKRPVVKVLLTQLRTKG